MTQLAYLRRRILSLVDAIASLTSTIIAGGTLILGIAAGFGRRWEVGE